MKIKLTQPLKVKDKEITEIDLNFEKLTGKQLADAEMEVRAMGDQTPSVFLSMKYHSVIVAKLIGVPVDDILAMNAVDYKNVMVQVAAFFLG